MGYIFLLKYSICFHKMDGDLLSTGILGNTGQSLFLRYNHIDSANLKEIGLWNSLILSSKSTIVDFYPAGGEASKK